MRLDLLLDLLRAVGSTIFAVDGTKFVCSSGICSDNDLTRLLG